MYFVVFQTLEYTILKGLATTIFYLHGIFIFDEQPAYGVRFARLPQTSPQRFCSIGDEQPFILLSLLNFLWKCFLSVF